MSASAAPSSRSCSGLRLAVHTDQAYRRGGDGDISTSRAFVEFVGAVGAPFDEVRLLGRLHPEPGVDAHHVADHLRFVALPWYASAAGPVAVLRAVAGSLRTFWRTTGEVDVVWLMGPSPLTLPFAALAALRRRPVVLGVRQDLPEYVRARHPGRPWLQRAAALLDGATRLTARWSAVVAVGPVIAERYRRAGAMRVTSVSLVPRAAVVPAGHALRRDWAGRRDLLTVSRLDVEKNPLLLADVLAGLDERWHLTVCGDGPLEPALRERLEQLGVADRATLRGYVTTDEGLRDLYRDSHAFLHVSHTEGVPQVLFEAFAAGLPVVATDVGGVAATAQDAALLVAAADAPQAVRAVQRIAADEDLREGLAERGRALVLGRTLEAEADAVARFIAGRALRSLRASSRARPHAG